MARFRNTTGYPLDFYAEIGATVGPGGEFDWPGYDEAVHGPVPGCERLDKPAPEAAPADDGKAAPSTPPAASKTAPPSPPAAPAAQPAPGKPASEETPR